MVDYNLRRLPSNLKRISRVGMDILAIELDEDNRLWVFNGIDWVLIGEIRVVHGKDGVDGADGKPGSPGLDGVDGLTPEIEVDQDNYRIRFNTGGRRGNWVDLPRGPRGGIGPAGKSGRDGRPGESIRGERGPAGVEGNPGKDGRDGSAGPMPRHEWSPEGDKIRFETASGEWGSWSGVLVGRDGKDGKDGKHGTPGRAVAVGSGASGASNHVRWRVTTADFAFGKRDPFEGLKIDATDGDVTITLPNVAITKSKVFFFKRVDSSDNTVTIQPSDGTTIDGEDCMIIGTRYQNRRISSDGTEWLII